MYILTALLPQLGGVGGALGGFRPVGVFWSRSPTMSMSELIGMVENRQTEFSKISPGQELPTVDAGGGWWVAVLLVVVVVVVMEDADGGGDWSAGYRIHLNSSIKFELIYLRNYTTHSTYDVVRSSGYSPFRDNRAHRTHTDIIPPIHTGTGSSFVSQ